MSIQIVFCMVTHIKNDESYQRIPWMKMVSVHLPELCKASRFQAKGFEGNQNPLFLQFKCNN